jgi:hypothetical protein
VGADLHVTTKNVRHKHWASPHEPSFIALLFGRDVRPPGAKAFLFYFFRFLFFPFKNVFEA